MFAINCINADTAVFAGLAKTPTAHRQPEVHIPVPITYTVYNMYFGWQSAVWVFARSSQTAISLITRACLLISSHHYLSFSKHRGKCYIFIRPIFLHQQRLWSGDETRLFLNIPHPFLVPILLSLVHPYIF